MDYTSKYQLPVWAETDRILRTDFNDMTEVIDQALSTHDNALNEISSKGNCQLYTTSYTGTGSTNKPVIFPTPPKVVIVTGAKGGLLVMQAGLNQAMVYLNGEGYLNDVSWSGTTVYWYSGGLPAQSRMNTQGEKYQVLALIAMDQ